jgi:hypothetical protein
MATVDPSITLRDWRSALYRGEPAVIDRFLDTIDATLSSRWVRDLVYERTRLRPDRIRCYPFDNAGGSFGAGVAAAGNGNPGPALGGRRAAWAAGR